jgi:nucleotide-binding universal stress UspA family protein
MLFSHILVPYDGSELAEKSLEKAIDFAKLDPNTKITVLHVVEFPPKTYQYDFYHKIKESILADAEKIMRPAKFDLGQISNSAEMIIKEGLSYKVILETAKERQCDLILMGSRGLNGIKEFLGSVSHTVTQRADIPVLLMK